MILQWVDEKRAKAKAKAKAKQVKKEKNLQLQQNNEANEKARGERLDWRMKRTGKRKLRILDLGKIFI